MQFYLFIFWSTSPIGAKPFQWASMSGSYEQIVIFAALWLPEESLETQWSPV